MGNENRLSRESFLFLAGAAGLKTDDPHMEELYAYVQEVLPRLSGTDEPPATSPQGGDLHTFIVRYMPKLKPLDRLDLTGLDPEMVFRPLPRRKHE